MRPRRGGPELDDLELVKRAQQGEADAYDALVRRHQEVAFRVAYLIVGDPAEAEDAAQESLVKAYRALGRFQPGAAFRPWLLQIVANEARNRRTARHRRATLLLRAAAEQPAPDVASSPEAAALAREEREALLAALDGLRTHDRQAIACRYFLDLSEGEMAEVLGCARGTVKSRLSRALQRLRERLVAVSAAVPRRTEPVDA